MASAASIDPAQPAITAIRLDGTNVVVDATIPAGIKRVTLESRARFGAGSWEPRAVTRLDGNGGGVSFRVPKSAQLELLRVRADATETLPSLYYRGTNSFAGAPAGGAGPGFGDSTSNPPGGTSPTRTTDDGGAASRQVVESDIWKIQGDTLYFFNQNRGLQVIDLANPDSPVVRGALSLPAAGEQMYLLDSNHVVLLARGNCYWTLNGNDSEAIVVAVTNGIPQRSMTLFIPGWIQESRMVGTALYVASQSYRVSTNRDGAVWEWGTIVSSFDLSNPASPAARDTLWYSGYGNVITATDRFLFVATQDLTSWWRSTVRYIDISSPNGTMTDLASIRTAGRVNDKFKMNLTGDVFTTISEDWHWDGGTRLVTKLETFSLANRAAPQKQGELELGRNERLHATRFDGDRVYVVTFFQIDPLWVVDLSDPTRPRITGELQVPGWSTYIQPLGDRLVAVGVESNRVAVSLFDLHDPTQPGLLSKVRLGENYSWSEANTDDKAFGVFPDDGLILLPYQGNTTNGYASRVQLIDLGANALAVRGVIEHRMQPRRATVHGNRVLSLSGWELLSVDATDRDQPIVRAETELAWSVDRLFLQGDYVIEISTGTTWDNQFGPTIHVALAADPDRTIRRVALSNELYIAGAAIQDGRLYLAQSKTDIVWPVPLTGDGTNVDATITNSPTLFLSIFDLRNLPEIPLLGKTDVPAEPLGWNPSLQPLWPKPNLLVWAGGDGSYPWVLDAVGGRPLVGDAIGIWRPWYGGNGGRLIAFDVANASSPRFVSDVNLIGTNRWGFSQAYAVESFVYLSHQSSDYMPPVVGLDAATGKPITNQPPQWVQRWYLDAVDYGDPNSPTVRRPVNIPGTLNGISHAGALLYTVGQHWDSTNPTNGVSDWSEWLDASAYDGVSAHLVDSLQLPKTWPHPILVHGPNIFISRAGETTSTGIAPSNVETWILTDSGKFAQSGATSLESPASSLIGLGDLLVVQQSDQRLNLYSAVDPAKLRLAGQGRPEGCIWYDLTHADGAVDRGLWIPLGSYGVMKVGLFP